MSATAKLNNLRMAPRKVRMVADLIRGRRVQEAATILSFTVRSAVPPIAKLLNSAVANAKNNAQMQEENLYISKITVDEGPKLKRWRARARGQAYEIQKKTSHITMILDEVKPGRKKAKKAQKKTPEIKEVPKAPKEPSQTKTPERKPSRFGQEQEAPKPKAPKGIKRIFRRKSM